MRSKAIELYQLKLKDLGFNPGKIDGQWGPDYYRAIAKAIALGGDADTLACIVGSMYNAVREGSEREFPNKIRDIAYESTKPEFAEITINFLKKCLEHNNQITKKII